MNRKCQTNLLSFVSQRILKHSRFGRISVKCYYDAPEQRLTVEILHAADLIALDANGTSESQILPFLSSDVSLDQTWIRFSKSRPQRPVCDSGALSSPSLPHVAQSAYSSEAQNPAPSFRWAFLLVSVSSFICCSRRNMLVIDSVIRNASEWSSFCFFTDSHVSPEQYRHRCACLTFTVMDYDWLSTNDFAGEAVAPLSDFCWPGRPSATPAGKSLQPVILHLSRQKPSGMFTLYSANKNKVSSFLNSRNGFLNSHFLCKGNLEMYFRTFNETVIWCLIRNRKYKAYKVFCALKHT